MFQFLEVYKFLLFSSFLNSKERGYDDLSTVGILATGGPDGGGSGARVLIEKILNGEFAEVNKLVLITNYTKGGVAKIFEKYKDQLQEIDVNLELKIVKNFPKRGENGEFTPEDDQWIRDTYQEILTTYGLDYLHCSGWMKHILGLSPSISQNIHPGPTKEPYGGLGMHGDNVHELVWEDYQKGIINQSCVTMHFVIEELDRGPISVQIPVSIASCKSADDVGSEVNKTEHKYQYIVYKMLLEGKITWSGNKEDPVQIDKDELEKYDFPEGTVFGGEVELNKWAGLAEAEMNAWLDGEE
ncbi:hypothetical protein A9Q91_01555 [Candidatus Gracilibacteria bacterium 28_42_T64]|nr:hypothetical protein A9Q91_01555 [Candidatus Gracilibacteria bacterium 28_42_T64]